MNLPIQTARNPVNFDLAVDPINLRPTDTAALGTTRGGWGLLGAGGGYRYSMPSDFVNENGLRHTATSGMATDFLRPGNLSLAATDDIVNSLRVHAQVALESQRPLGEPTVVAQSLDGFEIGRSEVTTLVSDFNGSTLEARIFYNSNGEPLGIQALESRAIDSSYGTIQYENGTYYVFPEVSNSAEVAGFYRAPTAHSVAPYVVIGGAGRSDLYTDPVVLDEGGDGVRMSALPVSFDLDADGSTEPLPWAAPTDPLLVIDRNGDGRISNGSELVDLTDADAPLNLFTLDENGDLVLDAQDSSWGSLQLWRDRNQDGYASPEERQSLTEIGIVSIDVDPSHRQVGTVAGISNVQGVVATYSDASLRTLWDVPFQGNTATPVTQSVYAVGIDRVVGAGETALMATTPLDTRIDLNGSGATQALGHAGDDTLIGTAQDDWLVGGAGADRFSGGAGRDLLVIDAEDRLADIDGGSDIDTIVIADDRGVFLNLYQTDMEVVFGGYGDDVLVGGGADNYSIGGGAGDDLIIGGVADDVLSGEDGDDVIDGLGGDDLLRGHRGEDQLFGGDGNDVLDGDLGNDTIQGGDGDDVTIASGGDDVIDGGAGIDLIELHGELEDYRFTRNTDGTTTITDLVADRDGIETIRNVERFAVRRNGRWLASDLEPSASSATAPMPVNDRLTVPAQGIVSIPMATLLANDSNSIAGLSVSWVGDAVGGTVQLSGNNVLFTPADGYVGPMEFAYRTRDSAGHTGPIITNSADPSIRAEAKGRVFLSTPNGPTDPDFVEQWYLGVIGATQVWGDYTGEGVRVLVLEPSGQFAVEDQVADLNHPDLVANKSAAFVDTSHHSNHATAVAGVIAAARNGIGGVGVAYGATVDSKAVALYLSQYAGRIGTMSQYDIVNNSWGHLNPWNHSSAYSSAGVEAGIDTTTIRSAARNGRGGLGTVMVFAAGNDRSRGYDAGLSSLTSNPFSIAVAAVNRVGDIGSGTPIVDPFSNRGANILIAAPGSDIRTTGVQFATPNGSVVGEDSQTTQGTSFAAPIVSGVAALMLQANPNLSYRDVQTILALTARRSLGPAVQPQTVWSANANRNWNGTGMHFSHDLGFGLVDARAAVRMAETWNSLGGTSTLYQVSTETSFSNAVSDLGSTTLSFSVPADATLQIEQVVAQLNLDHARWSDLTVTLVSPAGTASVLLDRTGVHDGTTFLTNPNGTTHLSTELASTHFRGENTIGTWQLIVEDRAGGIAGSGSVSAHLDFFGADPTSERYVLTDEYQGGWNLTPDWRVPTELNASALSAGVRIDLSGSTPGLVNGFTFNVSQGIDRLIGGEGADTLIGSLIGDSILGARGNDTIDGGADADELVGGEGDDELHGGSGSDLLVADTGNDRLWGGADSDVFLVKADGEGVVEIRDFNAGAGGDVLIVQEASRIPFVSFSQALRPSGAGTELVVRFTSSDGRQRSIVFSGVSSTLSDSQLRSIVNGEDLAVDPTTGGYTGRSLVRVEPAVTLRREEPRLLGTSYAGAEAGGFIAAPPLGVDLSAYRVFTYSQNRASVEPGERIAVILDNPTEGLSRYTGRYLLLDQGVLEAQWSGLQSNNFGLGLRLLIESNYSNNGQGRWVVDEVYWSRGTENDDYMVPGEGTKPDQLSDFDWEYALDLLRRRGPRTYQGFGGNDEIVAGDEGEVLEGGAGNDILLGNGGNDILDGGGGSDRFVFRPGFGHDTLRTESQDDSDRLVFEGTVAPSWIAEYSSTSVNGFDADITISAGGDSLHFVTPYSRSRLEFNDITLFNAETLSGLVAPILTGTTPSENSDVLIRQIMGTRTVDALGGNDVIFATDDINLVVRGGEGNDTLYVAEGSAWVDGGAGNDRIEVQTYSQPYLATPDVIIGGLGTDTINSGSHGSTIYGDLESSPDIGSGDVIHAGAGMDTIYGGGGDDRLFGEADGDLILGEAGNDWILGGAGTDTIFGDDGRDVLDGGDDGDNLYGGTGDDTVSGGQGQDNLAGEDGNDNLSGGTEDDYLDGGSGNDTLIGGEGDDWLVGGIGNDVFVTGSGHDTIELDLYSGNDIADSLTGVDTVVINGVANSNSPNLQFELLDNGARVKLSWGTGFNNSLTLSAYNFSTSFKFDTSTVTLRQIFESRGYRPDDTFDYIGIYDTQLQGNPNLIGTLIGGQNDDLLYGGPLDGTEVETPEINGVRYGGNNAAYWYVVGRQGEDSLAAGLSGAFLDGGVGNDSFRGSNGVTILRDTFHGGQDTLVMPEGVTPESLRFYRIPNPLEVAYRKTEGSLPYVSGAPIGPQVKLPSNLFPNRTSYDWQSVGDSFDTLRIQTLDGKLTVDVADYFASGRLKNDIVNVIFPTVFDADGNSINYALGELAGPSVRGGEYRLNGSVTWPPDQFDDIAGKPYADYRPLTDARITIGGEDGAALQGKVKVTNVQFEDVYGQYGSYVETLQYRSEVIVSNTQYDAYRQNAYTRDLNYLNGDRSFINGIMGTRNTDSFYVTAIALPDTIFGFGGNDTIYAGGAYVETHYSGQGVPGSWSNEYDSLIGSTRFNRYYAGAGYWDNSVVAGVYFDPWDYPYEDPGLTGNSRYSVYLWDEVNGGDGDDVYVYRRGDGELHIISLDEPYGGHGGFDTLDLSDFARAEVSFYYGFNGELGTIQVPNPFPASAYNGQPYPDAPWREYFSPSGSNDLFNNISLHPSVNGALAVDQIRFSDGVLNVQDLYPSGRLTRTAADSRTYLPTRLALAPSGVGTSALADDFGAIGAGLSPGYVLEGTPLGDVILVPQNGLVQGYEGGDLFVVDIENVDFTVIPLDRGDYVRFVAPSELGQYSSYFTFARQNSYGIHNAIQFAGSQDASGRYLGRSEAEWLASGVVPTDLLSWPFSQVDDAGFAFSYPGVGYQMQLGKLDRLAAGTVYSLTDWHAADGTSDDLTDIMISWTTRSVSGTEEEHHAILVGVVDDWGDPLTDYSLVWTGTQGDDYVSYLFDVTSWFGRPNEMYLLGGNDTFAGYANDVYQAWAEMYVGIQDVVYGGGGNDSLDGGASDDRLFGGEGDDQLIGGFGNDYLDGGTGRDQLVGGVGDDSYFVDSDDVVVELAGNQNFSTPAGTTLTLSGGMDEVRGDCDIDLSIVRFANVENGTVLGTTAHRLTGSAIANRLTGNGAGSTLAGGAGDDTYIVSSDADTIVERPNEGVDTVVTTANVMVLAAHVENLRSSSLHLSLFGNSAANEIAGDDGDNLIDGGGGQDSLVGGDGNDTYVVDSNNDRIIELAGEGYDIVWVAQRYALANDASVEEMRANSGYGVELTGNAGSNSLFGGAGEDTLDGGTGNDTLIGNAGDDTYIIDASDTVIENANEGIDTVQAAFSYTLGANLETLTLVGTSSYRNTSGNLNGGGNELANTLIGTNGANLLVGGAGDDLLQGRGGGDYLIGGAGADTYLVAATDLRHAAYGYYYNIAINQIQGDSADTLLFTDLRSDQVRFERGTFRAYYDDPFASWEEDGTSGNLRIVGPADYNSNDGLFLFDYFQPNGAVASNALARIEFADGVALTFADVRNRFLQTSAGNDRVFGFELAEILDGGAGDDLLQGNGGNDALLGGAGNDYLYGGDGVDTLDGGTGNDTLLGYAGNDTLYGRAGHDSLRGMAGQDTLYGDEGNDTLSGGEGDDLLNGGTGDDILYGEEGDDRYLFGRGQGADTIADGAGLNDIVNLGVNPLDVVFSRNGNHLQTRLHGGTDTLTVNAWYAGAAYQTEVIEAADASTLLNTQVDQLIQAMATFSANNGGISWDQAIDQNPNGVQAVIAAYWQPGGVN